MGDVKEVLVSARSKIANDGWVQGTELAGDGRVCSMYAINSSASLLTMNGPQRVQPGTFRHTLAMETVDVMETAISERFPQYEEIDVIDWNDWDGRTQEEVLDTFDHAIKLADQQGR